MRLRITGSRTSSRAIECSEKRVDLAGIAGACRENARCLHGKPRGAPRSLQAAKQGSYNRTSIMLRPLLAILLAWPLLAANVRLYLKDGSSHVVREYEIKPDRVRFYSVERSEWEEIPLDLVDLKRTKAEQEERESERKAETAALDAEDKAERAVAREISRVRVEPGAYWVNGEQLVSLKLVESKVNSNKGRSILKAISPVPVFSGKATVEVDGEAAALRVTAERPEFYFRLAKEERFGIVRVTPQK